MPWSTGKASVSRLAIVGEAPGWQEDNQGSPFVGDAGQLARRWLRDVGIDLWVCAWLNAVSCYPHGTPTKESVEACHGNMMAQLEHLKPECILIFGRVALESLTGLTLSMAEAHGWWWRTELSSGSYAWTTATYHPASVLRGGPYTQTASIDLLGLASVLNRNATPALGESCIRCRRGIYARRNDIPFCGSHWPKDPIKVTQEKLV